MRRLGWFLLASMIASLPCCGRTSPARALAGTGGTIAMGGATGTGGISAQGGAAGGSNTAAQGGTAGRSSPAGDGSALADPDTCTSDADCAWCIWKTTPTDSDQCIDQYCCGGSVLSVSRCEANQAAWAIHCPGQAPQAGSCPCVALCQYQVVACLGGRCGLACPPKDAGAADATFATDGERAPYCGDGLVTGIEECDKGSANSSSTDPNAAYGKCMANCRWGGYCGDAVVNGPEQCDNGVNDGAYKTCSPDCTQPPWCGDGILQPDQEECDDGVLDSSYGGCTPRCQLGPRCGDGIVQTAFGEECDDGPGNGRDAVCSEACRWRFTTPP
jgi:cysteine-rich repeat protein